MCLHNSVTLSQNLTQCGHTEPRLTQRSHAGQTCNRMAQTRIRMQSRLSGLKLHQGALWSGSPPTLVVGAVQHLHHIPPTAAHAARTHARTHKRMLEKPMPVHATMPPLCVRACSHAPCCGRGRLPHELWLPSLGANCL